MLGREPSKPARSRSGHSRVTTRSKPAGKSAGRLVRDHDRRARELREAGGRRVTVDDHGLDAESCCQLGQGELRAEGIAVRAPVAGNEHPLRPAQPIDRRGGIDRRCGSSRPPSGPSSAGRGSAVRAAACRTDAPYGRRTRTRCRAGTRARDGAQPHPPTELAPQEGAAAANPSPPGVRVPRRRSPRRRPWRGSDPAESRDDRRRDSLQPRVLDLQTEQLGEHRADFPLEASVAVVALVNRASCVPSNLHDLHSQSRCCHSRSSSTVLRDPLHARLEVHRIGGHAQIANSRAGRGPGGRPR